MNKKLRKRLSPVFDVLHNCREKYYSQIGRRDPKRLVTMWYKHMFGEEIDLENPQTINEKVNWMKFNADLSLWTRCADKLDVRGYVEEKGFGYLLNECYGVYDSPDEIDYDLLPGQFVVKTTNGGGGKTVLVVKDKSTLNKVQTNSMLKKWLRRQDGFRYYEPQYLPMKPRLIVEKYLQDGDGSEPLVDYKLNCFDGKVYNILLCSDRKLGGGTRFALYDTAWNSWTDKVEPAYQSHETVEKPASLEEMIACSEALSKSIPYVRIDWYEVDGKPIFGEMTFTPAGGFMHKYTKAYLLELGAQMHLPKRTPK